jgi:hypothetical protein
MMTPDERTPMRSMIEIDPNVRVRGNATYAGLEDVIGPVEVGREVTVRESEAGVLGTGRVTQIDTERELVYLSVEWSNLHVATQAELDKAAADAEWLAAKAVVFPYADRPGLSILIWSGVSAIVTGWNQSLTLNATQPFQGPRQLGVGPRLFDGRTSLLPGLVGVS